MFFMARATAPIFPGWVVPTRTMRIDIVMAQATESRVFYRPRGPDGQVRERPGYEYDRVQLFYIDGIVS